MTNEHAAAQKNFIIGVEFIEVNTTLSKIVALYAIEPYHSAPISLNMVQNTLLQEYMGDAYKITTSNKPYHPLCPSILDSTEDMPIFILFFMWGKLFIQRGF